MKKVPEHIGIIVDGNGRWATEKGLSRSMGHKAGAANLKRLCLHIIKKGVKNLSLYIFSTENFKRDNEEVQYLMQLFVQEFNKEFKKYEKENIKVIFSGRKIGLEPKVLEVIEEIESMTKDNTKATINFCLNYGSQYEIVDACNKLIDDNIKEVDVDLFNKYLYQDLPPIDLLIRTSGEQRLSNFMLFQAAYAELYFPKTYFPDFNNKEFDQALEYYYKRDRRFGGINNENKIN
jgi:undecaprenyl diphosphate synthase